MPDDDPNRELKFHPWGWIIFVIGSVLFVVSSIRNGDVLGSVAGVLFLVGCVGQWIKRTADGPRMKPIGSFF